MSDDNCNKIFVKNLKALLEKHNVSYAELADMIGVRPSTVSMWITGRSFPRIGAMKKIADCFNISVSQLTEDHETQNSPGEYYYLNDETRQIAQEAFENPELRSLFHVARDIPPERLKAHIEFMKSLKRQEKGDPDEPC